MHGFGRSIGMGMIMGIISLWMMSLSPIGPGLRVDAPQILDDKVANKRFAAAFVRTYLTHRVLGLDGPTPRVVSVTEEATAVAMRRHEVCAEACDCINLPS